MVCIRGLIVAVLSKHIYLTYPARTRKCDLLSVEALALELQNPLLDLASVAVTSIQYNLQSGH